MKWLNGIKKIEIASYMLMYLIIVSFSFIAVWLVIKVAKRRAIMDIPNERSSHTIPTPRGGGIAIAITWFLTISALFVFNKIDSRIYFALLCGVPISLIGLVDDVLAISAKTRLLVQIVSATAAIIILGGLKIVDLGCCIFSSSILLSFVAVIGIVWFTNLFNFLDGIDGYISVETIFICLAAFILFRIELSLFLAFATVGFLLWNWQPAKIFMGDVGSTLLGFTIGVFAVYYQNSSNSSILFWLMLSSLFWFDATLTLYRRWRNNESLSTAHRKHAYQRIVQSGFSHQKTVFASIVINIFVFGLAWLSVIYPTYTLIFLIVNVVFLYLIMRLVDKRFPFPKQ